MKDMRTDVLDDALSMEGVKSHDGPAVGTCQADAINKVSVRTGVLYHKTGLPWETSMCRYSNTSSTMTYHPVLDTENGQMVSPLG